jgi:Icc-related predicted phosphoesterase
MAHLTRLLCAADPGGSTDAIAAVADAAERDDAQAIAVVGNIGAGSASPQSQRAVFRALAAARRPVFWVPGPDDAPAATYLREAHNIEVAYDDLHGVHGTAALAPGEVVVAGLGGEISDDPDESREEIELLRYPRWEAEYRLKILREWPEHARVLLFHTHPEHKGLGRAGSDAVAELIGTFLPRVVVCGGDPLSEMLGRSLLVAPGRASDGHYAVVDLHSRTARLAELQAAR